MFVLQTHTGTQVQLLWDYYTILLYCRGKKIDLVAFGEHLSRVNTDLDVLTGFMQAAAQSATEKQPTEREVTKWIADCGGVSSMYAQGKLSEFINYVIQNSVVNTSEEPEKKSS